MCKIIHNLHVIKSRYATFAQNFSDFAHLLIHTRMCVLKHL